MVVIIGVAVFLIYSPLADNGGGGESRVGFSIRDFLPFGKSDDGVQLTDQNQDQNTPTSTSTSTNIGVIPRIRKVSQEPIAGAVIFAQGTTSVVRFVEKGTGNVYEARSDSNTIERLTNTTIPKIVRAFWLPNGTGFLAQTLAPESEIIETRFVKIARALNIGAQESLTPYNATISNLPTGIEELSIRPDSAKIFYYTISNLNSEWHISNPDGTADTVVYKHPLTEWLPTWLDNSNISLQSKPSGTEIGYVYSFNTSNGILKKNGTSGAGLLSTPKNIEMELASTGGTSPRLFAIDNKNLTSKSLDVATLADKCTWSSSKTLAVYCAVPKEVFRAVYPDDWYKGLLNFNDSIYYITIDPLFVVNTINLSQTTKEMIDVVDIKISPTDDHLIFKNKADGYLWLLRIAE